MKNELNIGQKFGKLTVLKFAYKDKKRQNRWSCLCECGKVVDIESWKLVRAKRISCGCSKRKTVWTKEYINTPARKNNKVTPEYRAWQHAKDRCTNKNNVAYNHYGGRGIMFFDRWANSFQNFFDDMGKRPSLNHSLDRYPNNDGNYEPNNCRWASKQEQARNTRRNNLISIEGSRHVMAELVAETGISPFTIKKRISRGVSIFNDLRTKTVINLETGIFYDSIADAAKSTNISMKYLQGQVSGYVKNKTPFVYA